MNQTVDVKGEKNDFEKWGGPVPLHPQSKFSPYTENTQNNSDSDWLKENVEIQI